ncbi:MAG: phosphodiester glycosidase family protein [Clostridia bacterium]|nr:phosphodiester glycosidase family protein [Clostridia bacterium]
MNNTIRVIVLLLLLVAVVVLVPSAVPMASAEDLPLPVYQPVELEAVAVQPLDFSKGTPYAPIQSAYLPDKKGYVDDTISVRVETSRVHDTDIMIVYVQIADASQIRTELCKPFPSDATIRPDRMAKRVNAVVAMNGDYFVYHSQGYIVRNGQLLRANFNEYAQWYDTLLIDDKGDFTIIKGLSEEKINAFEGNIMQAFTFGPGLVIDGVKCEEFLLNNNTPNKLTQRIGIAQMGPLSYMIVATEGPENKNSKGLTLPDFAQLMYDLGAKNAYNLDGGGSSAIILNNEKINALSTHKIRAVGDILYFVTAQGE